MEIYGSQAFGVMLALLFYWLGSVLYQKTKFPFFNPLLIASALLIVYISIAKLDLNVFLTDLSGINLFLGPLIVSLAIPIAKQIHLIKKNLIPIVVGSLVGALVSVVSVLVLGRVLGLDFEIIASMIPKSATTPIAVEVSERLGGIRSITVAIVVSSAVIGSVFIPFVIKLLRIKDPLVIGMGLGSTAHAVGTAKAMEIDSVAGAIAGIAMVMSGVFTAIIAIFL